MRLNIRQLAKNEENIQDQIKEIDDNLKRLQEIANPKIRMKLQEKGEELKKRNREFGNANPFTVLVIGRKI